MDLFHVLNRGVDKRVIFLDKQDYARFVHGLYVFNDASRSKNFGRLSSKPMSDLVGHSLANGGKGPANDRSKLVDIHGWCLMKNHYHLLLSEKTEGGITRFMMKLNVGCAKYFNEKYKRTGTLFQSRSKKIPITKDSHYMHILNYIHLNPLDYTKVGKGWREKPVRNAVEALRLLKNYKWSSYRDYAGIHNFPSILTTSEFFDRNYQRKLMGYLRAANTATISDVGAE